MRDVIFVTGNANKLKEVKMLLSSDSTSSINVINKALDLDELQDTDLIKIARDKCKQAMNFI